jgi:hypothetical protein
MPKTIQPYKHDCDRCKWVGWVVIGDKLGNMYLCVSGKLTEVIIRWSDEPSDYACYSSFEGSERKPVPIEIMGGIPNE